jgi:ankyrin repeat protein
MKDADESPAPRSAFDEALEALRAGDLLALLALLQSNPELPHARHPIDPERSTRPTLLHFAAIPEGETAAEATRALLGAGSDPNAPDDEASGAPPLAWAAASNQVGVAAALLDAGAAVDGRPDDPSGMSPLEHALFLGNREVAELLASRGANVSLPLAAGLGRLDAVRDELRAQPTIPDPPDPHESPETTARRIARIEAVFFAAINGRTDVVDLLIDHGAPVDLPFDGFGGILATPLHWAAMHGRDDCVRRLVERGADPTRHDGGYHLTPSGWARQQGHDELAAWLVAAEAQRGLDA